MAFSVFKTSATFECPAGTPTYSTNDLVANSATAADVEPLVFANAAIGSGGGFIVTRARLKKTNTTVTNASFRLHLYGSDPSEDSGIVNGDEGAWQTNESDYIGWIDIDLSGASGKVFSDCSKGFGSPDDDVGREMAEKLASGSSVYGLLQVLAGYTRTASEEFTVTLELVRN